MKVTAIILKYKKSNEELAERLKYLVEVCGIDEFFIASNSGKYNIGTAGGYTIGMKQVKDGFIWLLDEDNIPEPNALKMLKYNWEQWGGVYIGWGDKKRYLCLASYRKGYDKISDIWSVVGSENSVLGLNLFNYKQTRNNLKPRPLQCFADSYNRKIPVAMYGGMFFHSDLLKAIGYPNEKLFMYCDDFDWSYKISSIVLVKDSIINEPESKGNLYYNTRNHLIFQKQFVTSRFKFTCNYYAYCLYLIYKRNFKKFKALREGWK